MKNLHSFLILLALVAVISCKDKRPATAETDNLFKFKDYISYNTFGNKSIADPIRIELAKPLERFELTQEIETDFLKISPRTEGKLLIENGRTLIF